MNQVSVACEAGHCPHEAGIGSYGNPMRLAVDIP